LKVSFPFQYKILLCKKDFFTERMLIAKGCPRKWCLRDAWMWHYGTWFRDGIQGIRLMVGLHDPEGLFQPQWFHHAMKIHLHANATFLQSTREMIL